MNTCTCRPTLYFCDTRQLSFLSVSTPCVPMITSKDRIAIELQLSRDHVIGAKLNGTFVGQLKSRPEQRSTQLTRAEQTSTFSKTNRAQILDFFVFWRLAEWFRWKLEKQSFLPSICKTVRSFRFYKDEVFL